VNEAEVEQMTKDPHRDGPVRTGASQHRRRSVRIVSALAAAACVAFISACSSSSPGSGSAAASSGSSGAAASDAAGSAATGAAAAELAKYLGTPRFTAPGPSINVSSLKGETIYSIPQSDTIPFLSETESAEQALAAKLGIHWVEYPTSGTTAEWIRGIDTAIAAKANAILLNALDPRAVLPQIEAAKKAGIPVISAQFFDISQASLVPPALAGFRGDNFAEAARLEADWVIKDTAGRADVLVVENTEQLSTVAMLAAMKAEFAARCPACKVTYINVPSSDWATRIQPDVAAAVTADPSINYVIPVYDPMTQFVVPAIIAAGKQSQIHIATFNGTPAVLKMMQAGGIVRMDIGENLSWLASANLDELFRVMLKQPPLGNEKTALRVFTRQTVGQTGNPPQYDLGFGSSYATGYAKLWG
jgi:ribose transport system substrate-binding protein